MNRKIKKEAERAAKGGSLDTHMPANREVSRYKEVRVSFVALGVEEPHVIFAAVVGRGVVLPKDHTRTDHFRKPVFKNNSAHKPLQIAYCWLKKYAS